MWGSPSGGSLGFTAVLMAPGTKGPQGHVGHRLGSEWPSLLSPSPQGLWLSGEAKGREQNGVGPGWTDVSLLRLLHPHGLQGFLGATVWDPRGHPAGEGVWKAMGEGPKQRRWVWRDGGYPPPGWLRATEGLHRAEEEGSHLPSSLLGAPE